MDKQDKRGKIGANCRPFWLIRADEGTMWILDSLTFCVFAYLGLFPFILPDHFDQVVHSSWGQSSDKNGITFPSNVTKP